MINLIHKASKGVTLIEIVSSLLILSIVALSASGLMSYGHRGTMADFRQGEALQILVERLNFLSSLSFAALKKRLDTGRALINEPFQGKAFGMVKINQNQYEVLAELKYQSITFNCLKSLRLPNLPGEEPYKYNRPDTWHFVNRKPKESESFNEMSGDNAYAVIKITVKVCPVIQLDNAEPKRERQAFAITFVCNTEGC